MIRNKKHSSLILAGVSFVALTMATGSANAAGQTISVVQSGPWSLSSGSGDNDFLIFDGINVTDTFLDDGDVVIDEDVGAPNNGTAITLQDGVIEGDFIIEDVYVVGSQTEIGAGNVDATAAGIVGGWQNNGVEIGGSVINDGVVGGYAEAISTADLGADDDAEAFAFGGVFIGDQDTSFVNKGDGVVFADAYASAYDTSLAIAGGLIQADGLSGGFGGASISNAGTIYAEAEANAGKGGQDGGSPNGPYDPSNTEARAWAVALGTGQLVGDLSSGASFTNLAGADLTVLAAASAIDYSEATAGALGIGGAQIGLAGAGTRLEGENDGVIDVDVVARAEIIPFDGPGDINDTGSANAIGAGVGFLQLGLNLVGPAYAEFTNNYDIGVDVQVDALTPIAEAYDAQAMGIGLGLGQVVGTLAGPASANIDNYDTLLVDVGAHAVGGYAEADAFGIGTVQIAGALFGTASAALTNTSPDSIDVYANATATGIEADANAYVFGAGQVAASIIGPAFADVTNSGGILADGEATADATYDAYADADAAGVNQFVFSPVFAGANIDNSYDIEANASANAYSEFADADATAGATGANQVGIGGLGIVALNLTNQYDGWIDADATASAFAYETANASAGAAGFVQSGNGGSIVGLTAQNYGEITVDANAFASGAPGTSASFAFANAEAAGGVQEANTLFGDAYANLTNTGLMDVDAYASAFAYFSAYADAAAAGAVQELFAPAGDAYGLVTNSSGTMRVDANAYASSFDRAAYASAQAVGVSQDVDLAQNAFLTTRNSGDLRVDANATAIAYDTVAYAEARARGVNQEAFATGRAGVYTENTSDIFVTADAYAVGLFADATANATATGVAQDVESVSGFASAHVNNSGIYDIIGSAYATADSIHDFASADAFGVGVNQYVDGDSRAIASVENSAGIYGEALADAFSRFSSASATAQATGVRQDVYSENGTAVAYVNNTSVISGFADADAYVGSGGRALAEGTAYAIFQEVDSFGDGLYAQNAYAEVDNSGLVTADAFGHATGTRTTGDASATAFANAVFQNVYSETGVAYTRVSNTSALSLIDAYAEAEAFADDFASASADAVGISQEADAYLGNAYSDVFNEGTVQALARADAYSMTSIAQASASATGIQQDADSDYGEAGTFVDNSNSIVASAIANATAYSFASASASASGIDQDTEANYDATAAVNNTSTIEASARSYAEANGGGESDEADADSDAWGISQAADSTYGDALTSVYNEGSASLISAYATAIADAILYAAADASAEAVGIDQKPDGDGYGSAIANVANEGQIVAGSYASATNWEGYDDAYATAYAAGIVQDVENDGNGDGTGEGIASVFNGNSIDAIAKARATALGDNDSEDVGADAYASALAAGVYQDVYISDDDNAGESFGRAITTNTGNIRALGDAIAFSAYEDAYAEARGFGVVQDVENDDEGYAEAIVQNAGGAVISAGAVATASAWEFASASGSAVAVDQEVDTVSGDAYATVVNNGSIWANAEARAIGTGQTYLGASTAYARAWATGINQNTDSDEFDATSSVTNTSFLSIKASAYAEAIASVFAQATAVVDGVDQEAWADDVARVQTDNSGLISAIAFAAARTTGGSGSAFAYATASGLDQQVDGGDASIAFLANSGDLYGVAIAVAGGYDESYAAARAKGHNATSFNDLTLDVTNYESGNIFAAASAVAYDTANARAAAAWFEVFEGSILDGTIVNAGNISATAYASGATGEAEAFGVVMVSDSENNVTMTNTGVISAIGVGPTANATAIAVVSHYEESKGSGLGTTTINNDGGFIFAGEHSNNFAQAAIDVNGTTLFRGNWLNTRGFTTFNGDRYGEAPNAVVVNLTGGTDTVAKDIVEAYDLVSEEVQDALAGNQNYGYIFGNALLTDDDVLNFTDGVTIFDGRWNPDGEFYGEVNIFDEGKLVLVQNYEEGAAGGFVENFNLASNGTLVMELTPLDNGEGFDYSQINAINATTDGKFVALFTAGLYGNTMFYDNIIDAQNLSVADLVQGFAEVEDNSALLNARTVVDNEGGNTDNIDLYVDRIAFNAVQGMTDNQQAAGGAIEKVYENIDLDTDFGRLVSNLFTLDDGDYQQFMDQLTGAEHAQHLRSVLWSTRAINRIITERMECDTASAYRSASATSGAKVDGGTVMPTADAPMAATGCFDPGTASVWMRGFGQWNTLDGDENAPGGDETQYGIIFGGDYAFDENWFLGIAGGYFNSDGEFDDWGGRQGTDYDYDGLQLAAYGGYDNSTYYLRGVLSYGNYEGESNRMIAWPGGSPIDPSGDPSSNTFAFYGETGYRFDIGAGNITPFAGLNLATATLESFTEDDPDNTGAALEIHDSDANSIASVLGVRFDADMAMGSGIFTPTVSVAWMHEFADTPEVDMSFAAAPSGADFTVVASEVARDSILVDAGAKFTLGDSVDFGVYYNGQFNEDYSSNAITARLGYKF